MSLCRLLLVDDHPLMRDALRNLFDAEPGFEVVGEASEGEEAVARCLDLDPDVVLMDIRMPGMDGIEATAQIVERAPRSKVLALTTFSTLEYVVPALRAGASGYLVKDARHEEIVSAVLQVREDELALSPAVSASLANNVLGDVPVRSVRRSWRGGARGQVAEKETGRAGAAPGARAASASQHDDAATPGSTAGSPGAGHGPAPQLNSRELEALEGIARGLNNAEIAERMRVSHGSVKAYVSQLCEKLGARDRVQVLIAGIQAGLVRPELSEDQHI